MRASSSLTRLPMRLAARRGQPGSHTALPPARPFLLCALLAVSVLITGCSRMTGVGAPPTTLRIAGSSTMQPLLQELAAAYEQAHGNITVSLAGGGSQMGITAVETGAADIAAVSWAPDATAPTAGLLLTPIARDALTIIAHPRNPVAELTVLQLRALYRGEVLDWAALGGTPSEPIIISREEGSGDRQAFESLVMGGERVSLSALMLPTAAAVADYVQDHPAAIGYVSMAQQSDVLGSVAIEGLSPDAAAVQTGAYHLTRLLYLVTPERPSPRVRGFVDFVLSPAGQAIVARHHVALR